MIRRRTIRLLSALAAIVCWSSCIPQNFAQSAHPSQPDGWAPPVHVATGGHGSAEYNCSSETASETIGAYSQEWYMGTGRLYPETVPAVPNAPRGYVPVYLSHYGRHGSRYLADHGGYEAVAEVLSKAAADDMLTPLGEDIWSRYQAVLPDLESHEGELAPLGAEQHRRIAGRMAANFPHLFKGSRRSPARVIANSTNLERTMLSMLNFEQALLERYPSLDIQSDASKTYMGRINQHSPQNPKVTADDVRWKSLDAPWRPAFDRWCEELLDWRPLCGRLFKEADYICKLGDPVRFERSFFVVAQNLPSCPVDDCGFFRAFSDEDLADLGKLENYTFYVEKSRWPGGNKRGCYLSETVLGDILDRAAEDLSDGIRVRLRFGHDGCIMALLSMMKMDGWNTIVEDPGQAWQVWDASRIPMASNLQLVLFAPRRHASSPVPEDLLMLLMLNEEPLVLPLPSVHDHFYRWTDFLSYCAPILEEARAGLK